MSGGHSAARGGPYGWLLALAAAYAAALLVYSQTRCFTWDETYHVLAAQLIVHGRKPYLDFCFPQTPLNAYWNAVWMRLLGESWRVPHALAALLTAGAVFLVADYVFVRFPVPRWRLPAAILALAATGCNPQVFVFGPVGQAYGMCLFMLAAAFRVAVRAVDRRGPPAAAVSGCLAGAAAGSSLLTAAAAPVFLAWILWRNRAGSRWAKFFAFTAGAALPFAPAVWLFAQGARQTWFNIAQYHLFYRRLYWPEVAGHNFEVLTAWADSGPAFVTGVLAIFGLLFAIRRSEWMPAFKGELYLCACLAAALFAEVSFANPTFERYYLLGAPFLAVLAAAGLYAAASLLHPGGRPVFPVLAMVLLFVLGLGRALHDRSEVRTWGQLEEIARAVDRVTPPNAPLFAGEPIYFLLRRTPPPGFELTSYTHKIEFPPAKAALLHVVGDTELKRRIRSGEFATACTCFDSEVEDYALADVYARSVEMHDCTVYSDRKPAAR